MRSKWSSRKFWLAVAAFLGSIGTSIAGLATSNKYVATVGIVCSIFATAIYQVCESIVDVSHKKEAVNETDTDK
jgi:hypothetical protein